MLKLARFLVLNVLVNGFDQATDFWTFLTLYNSENTNWAYLTLTWMFAPLLIHLGKLLYFSILANIQCSNVGRKNEGEAVCKIVNSFDEFQTVMFQIPFGVPLRNLYLFLRLSQLGYDSSSFDPKNSKEVEDIFNEVGESGLYECFFEAGPQSVTQMVIFLCTGEMSTMQVVSITASLASLGWGASRAFFMSRKPQHVDPEPPFRMMRIVFPLMIIVVTNNMIMWTFVGGLLSRATPIAILINFISVYKALKVLTSEAEGSTETWVVLRASVFATWLPCVVSDRVDSRNRANFFQITAYVTLGTKIVLLGLAFAGTYTDTPVMRYLDTKPFVLWCTDREYFKNLTNVAECHFTNTQTSSCFKNVTHKNDDCKNNNAKMGFDKKHCNEDNTSSNCTFDVASEGFHTFDFLTNHDCFEPFCRKVLENCSDIDGDYKHKIRICDKGENRELYRLIFYIICLTISNLAAFFASRRLDRISDYKELYEVSKTLLHFIPIRPYAHRSHLFELVNNKDADELEKVLHEDFGWMADCANRTNTDGDTLLHVACKNGSADCVGVLLMAGAERKQNSPLVSLSSSNSSILSVSSVVSRGRKGNSAGGSGSSPLYEVVFPDFTVLFQKDEEANLKRLAYKLIEAGCEGKQKKRDICEIMQFDNEKLLGLVDNLSKKMVLSWAHPGMKHYLENPELLEALMKWHKDEGDLKKSKRDEIKASLRANRGNLIPIDGISKQKRRSLKECVKEWNKTAQGRKCKIHKFFTFSFDFSRSINLRQHCGRVQWLVGQKTVQKERSHHRIGGKNRACIGHIRVILTPTGENYQRLGLSSPGKVHGAKEISDYKMLHLDIKTQIWNQLDVLATSWSRLDDGDEPGEIYTLTRWYPHSYIYVLIFPYYILS